MFCVILCHAEMFFLHYTGPTGTAAFYGASLKQGMCSVTNRKASSPDALRFVTEHIPCFSKERKTCVVCWQKEKKQYKVNTYCKAPQCNWYMHISTSDKNCFEVYHSPDYPYKR